MDDQKIAEAFQKVSDRVNQLKLQLEVNDRIQAKRIQFMQDQLDDLNEMIEDRPLPTTRHHLGS